MKETMTKQPLTAKIDGIRGKKEVTEKMVL